MPKQGGLTIFFILALASAGFFYGQKSEASQSIVINEVLIRPAENRFIELYNPNNFPVDLTGWYLQRKTQTGTSFTSLVSKTYFEGKIIETNGYFLISRSAVENADIVLSSLTLTDSNIIQLKDLAQEIVDIAEWGAAPEDNKSLERENDGSWQIGQSAGGTPRAANSVIINVSPPVEQPVAAPPTNNNSATSTGAVENSPSSSLLTEQKNNFGDVLINELVSDPADNEVEWIELYSKAGYELDLTGWRLEDGSKAKTNLSGSLDKYKVIEKPNGNLNNSGDLIILYDASGKIIDQAAYGNWPDGNMADNAPVAGDPYSLARKFDGYNTYNNLNDFAATFKPTKGGSNIIEIEDEASAEIKAKFDFSSDIYLSEILPNPDGDDIKLEFIEIYNAGAREVNLIGWSLSREDDKKVNLEKIATSTIIKAGEYLAFFRPRTKIVLHNDQGQVKLFQPLADKPLMIVDYKNVEEGLSYNLVDYKTKNEWVWSENITPGAANLIKAINHPPEAEFSFKSPVLVGAPTMFDGSDAFDDDGDKLIFSWDFGDGFKNSLTSPGHTYLKIGIYNVRLEVSDGQAASTIEKSVKAVSSLEVNLNIESPLTSLLKGGEENVIINEIFPNPEGADTGQEWLELKNQSPAEINLLNWRLENSNGKYKFNSGQLLEGGIFYVLDNVKSKLAFKNTDDVISLYNNLDELVVRIEYSSAVQGETYARGANGNWFWTTRLTPGEENIINLAGSKSVTTQAVKIAGGIDSYVEADLEKVKELEIGSLVKIKGTVAVEPGILGVQIFYIVGSPGIQIYNYKKNFPVLRIGDYIEVTGELAQTQGELRIKTKDKNDINLIEYKAPPVALAIKAEEVGEENIGQLIIITGEITDKKSTSLYIDDGSDEVFAYIKQSAGIDIKNLAAGQKVSVRGILSKTSTGFRLLPRSQEDVVLIGSTSGDELEPQVLGEIVSADEWDLAERDKKLELFKYLLIIAGGIIIILVGLFIKAKKNV